MRKKHRMQQKVSLQDILEARKIKKRTKNQKGGDEKELAGDGSYFETEKKQSEFKTSLLKRI
jgi:hypothetical protein